MPLSMLLRDAGVAAMTSLHRISYKELLMDSRGSARAEERAQAAACGPTLPGQQDSHTRANTLTRCLALCSCEA